MMWRLWGDRRGAGGSRRRNADDCDGWCPGDVVAKSSVADGRRREVALLQILADLSRAHVRFGVVGAPEFMLPAAQFGGRAGTLHRDCGVEVGGVGRFHGRRATRDVPYGLYLCREVVADRLYIRLVVRDVLG